LLSFWADEQVCELHAAGITVKDRQSEIYELYHGTKDANNISLIEQLCTGLNQFASIFDIELEATTAESSTQNDPTKTLILKQRLVRQPDMRLVAGTSFNKRSLSGSSINARGLISGKSLYNYSQDVAKNVMKALSLFYDYMDKDGDGNPAYPSGKSQEDLDIYILTGMYKYLHATITTIDTDSSETDVNARVPSAVTLQIVRDDATLKKETLDDMKRCRGEVLLAKTDLDMFTRACKRKKANSAVEDYLAKTGVAVKPKTSDSFFYFFVRRV
jgi:hypothetical protein